MINNFRLFSFSIICLAILIGCGGQSNTRAQTDASNTMQNEAKPSAQVPQRIFNAALQYGECKNVAFTLGLIAQTPNKKLTFEMDAWINQDNQLSILLSKVGHRFLQAVIQEDGRCLVVFPRDELYYEGSLNAIAENERLRKKPENKGSAINLLNEIQLFSTEIKQGPMPHAPGYEQIDENSFITKGLSQQRKFSFEPGSYQITSKELLNENNEAIASITYSLKSYKKIEGLVRPRALSLAFANNEQKYQFRLRKFDVVPSIDNKRYQLQAPQQFTRIDENAFLDMLSK